MTGPSWPVAPTRRPCAGWRWRRAAAALLPCLLLPALLSCLGAAAHAPGVDSLGQLDGGERSGGERAGGAPLRVLAVSLGLRGHATPVLRLAAALASKGHHVTVVSHTSAQPWVERAHAVAQAAAQGDDAAGSVAFVDGGALSRPAVRAMQRAVTRDGSTFRGILTLLSEVYGPAQESLDAAAVAVLERGFVDVAVVDMGAVGVVSALGRLRAARVPVVVQSPTLLMASGDSASYTPSWGTGFSLHGMSSLDRCMNVLFPRLLSVALTPPFIQLNKAAWEAGVEPFRSQHELLSREPVAAVLVPSAFGFEYPRPLPPRTVLTGPLLPPAVQLSPLAGPVADWLEAGPRRAVRVYLRLGASVVPDDALAGALVEALRSPRAVRVLWALPSDLRALLPPLPASIRVRAAEATPHFSVLASPLLDGGVVVTACGLALTQEALLFGRPVVCIPLWGDQPDVAARVADAGVGAVVERSVLLQNPRALLAAVQAVAGNASMAGAAAKLGRRLERAGGVARAAGVVEEVARLGTSHLRVPGDTLPWHSVAMLDCLVAYQAAAGFAALWAWCAWHAFNKRRWLLDWLMGSKSAASPQGAGRPAGKRDAPSPGAAQQAVAVSGR